MLNQLIKNVKKEKSIKENVSSQMNENEKSSEKNGMKILPNLILEQNIYSQKMQNPDKYLIDCGLRSLYYLPDYLTNNDKKLLLEHIYAQENSRWDILPKANRRLQKWGGDVMPSGIENQENLPQFFQVIAEKLHKQTQIIDKMPNHVLLNEYPAQVGIMPHTDGPLYYNFVCSISLMSDCLFKFYKDYESYKKKEFLVQILCEDGCLSCFSEDLYKNYLHCIEDIGIEYVYVNIKENKENNNIEVINSNVANFRQTNMYKKLLSYKNIQDAENDWFLYPIQNQNNNDNNDHNEKIQYDKNNKDNSQIYNYAIEIVRKKRISLTIRHVQSKQQL